MNAVEIEQAISDLALEPLDAAEFPYAFLAAFGNKDTKVSALPSASSGFAVARDTLAVRLTLPLAG